MIAFVRMAGPPRRYVACTNAEPAIPVGEMVQTSDRPRRYHACILSVRGDNVLEIHDRTRQQAEQWIEDHWLAAQPEIDD